MKRNLPQIQYSRLQALYVKLSSRLNKQFKTGRFLALTKAQQTKLLQRIERIKGQLHRMSAGLKLSGAALALGAVFSSSAVQAQFATVGSEFLVNTYTTSAQQSSSIAIDSDGDFVLVWESEKDGSIFGVYGQRYNASGIAQGSEFQVNTYTTSVQGKPSVAMDSDGDFVVVWQSYNQDGNGYGIYGQRYNASGITQGGEFRINTFTTDEQNNPSVAMDSDGDFVVTWQSSSQDGNESVYGQRYNALGVAQGLEFRINTSLFYQNNPSLAMDSDGDFVVTWQGYGQEGSYYGIYGQRYNASGVAQGAEFRVNTYTTNYQINSSVAMDSDGDFVVTWQSRSQDGNQEGIYGQRYNASGVAQGSEFRVNTYTTSVQSKPSVAMDSDGDFVVTWQSGQDGDGYGIYGQRYNASGVAQGSEFLINTYITNSQTNSSTALSNNGSFVVTWQSNGQDGSQGGIYGQRYSLNNTPVIAAQSFSIAENASNGTAVGTVSASDADASQTLSYAITAGNTGSVFAINSSTGAITVAGSLDFETTTSYALTVEVTDNGLPTKNASATVTITITDVLETTSVLTGTGQSALVLYPNPAKDEVSFNLEGEVTVTILDLSGQVIREAKVENQSFNIAGLNSGVYLVELSKDGQKATQKLVVE